MGERIFYAASVHDEAEIDAVVEVLRGGAAALWPGRNVNSFERAVAERFGKQRGLMCNSGSSALYLAVELADLPPGSEVITAAVTFLHRCGPAGAGRSDPGVRRCRPRHLPDRRRRHRSPGRPLHQGHLGPPTSSATPPIGTPSGPSPTATGCSSSRTAAMPSDPPCGAPPPAPAAI